MLSRLTYRSRQFRNTLFGSRKQIPSEAVLAYLTPAQFSLFQRMQPSEQEHAYSICRSLEITGQSNPDLFTAALLHDVGKILHPLSIFERVMVVMGKYLFRGATRRWAAGTPRGLRRPFVVAANHARWGAELARQAGATPLAVDLIRRHHEALLPNPAWLVERLLAALQSADNEN
jgi:putative nucleotidyltransferase with HDIG domain